MVIQLCCTFLGPSGNTTTFEGVPPGYYNLRVAALANNKEARVYRRVYVPANSNTCSVNLINAGVVVNGNSATVEFLAVGAATSFKCRLDKGCIDTCEYTCSGQSDRLLCYCAVSVKPWLPCIICCLRSCSIA